MPNVFENVIQSLPACPRCDEPVTRVIFQLGEPTKYFHSRNNQSDLIHEDLTTDIKVEDNG